MTNMPNVTDWMSAIATLVAALAAAAAALYTKRAAEAGAKAASEAARQVSELQALREPKALVVFRVPDQFTGENQVKYGKGNYEYRSGTPVFLDVWNVSSPTIMVMEVAIKVKDVLDKEERWTDTLTPQRIIKFGDMGSFNVAYQLMHKVSSRANRELMDIPDGSAASARFVVKYVSAGGERVVEADCRFRFAVTEDQIFTFTSDQGLTGAGGNYFPSPNIHL
jgi:hypothetical protein